MAQPRRPSEPPLRSAAGRQEPDLPARGWDWWRVAEGIASLALGAALLIWGLPLVAGADWSAIGEAFAQLTLWQVALLGVVWQFGLWIHTIALCAALPGLSSPRAWFLNQTGSAVSNVLPLGGAAGTALNYSTCRVWGFGTTAFLRWAIATNIWDILGKLVVPAVAVLWLVVSDTSSPEALVSAAVAGVVILALFVAFTWFMLHRDVGMRVLGRLLDALVRSLRVRRLKDQHFAADAGQFRRDLADLVAHAWGRLTIGKAAYALSQAFLLWLCIFWLGGSASPAVVFAAFAAERVLSMAVVTPGATGLVEVGMTGTLVSFGVDPATAAASVLLYRAFIIGLEIPVGGAALLWWLIRTRRTRRASRGGGVVDSPTGAGQGTRP
jgi:uncharacterized membrane protein YbhN (UPF0104 family)